MIESGETILNPNLRIGRRIYHLESVTSTSSVLMDRMEESKQDETKAIPEGTVLRADEQTAGRGRLNRTWQSPKGKGLWFSIYLRPDLDLSQSYLITFSAACAMADVVRDEFQLKAEIKWPNDVLLNKKKFCGILTETRSEQNTIDYAVLGIGINLNQTADEIDSSYGINATSLRMVVGHVIEDDAVFNASLKKLDEYYYILQEKKFDLILNQWRKRAEFFGKTVMLAGDNGESKGVAKEVDQNGGLVLELEDGQERTFYTGSLTY